MDQSSSPASFMTVVTNLASQASDIGNMLYALAYLLGVVAVVSALRMAKASADPAARADHGKSAWVWSLAVGALMFWLPTTIASIANSMFGPAAATDLSLAYLPQTGRKLAPLVPVLKVIGLIAVIRGLWVFRTVGMYGNYSKGNATFGRGLTLVLAGVVLVHMKNVLEILTTIVGVNLGANMF